MKKYIKYIINYVLAYTSTQTKDSRKNLLNYTTNETVKNKTYTIGITTFDNRFEKYFTPLLKSIKKYNREIEVIVAINGNLNKGFNQKYRREILQFLSDYENVYPIFFTEFRSLSKMWNTILVHSSCDNILLLNDDITIQKNFWTYFNDAILGPEKSFTINKSWSHVYLDRREIAHIGWFDERLLGLGEEDGDMQWRYEKNYKVKFGNFYIPFILNHVEMNDCDQEFQKTENSKKYSSFNLNFIRQKYTVDEINGEAHGLFKNKIICKNENINQYPYEEFYWENRNKI